MNKQELFDALNQTAKDLNLFHWINIDHEIHVPVALTTLSALIFQKDFKQNKNTDLIKEQSLNLITKGMLIWED
jgi:hypothetical protein